LIFKYLWKEAKAAIGGRETCGAQESLTVLSVVLEPKRRFPDNLWLVAIDKLRQVLEELFGFQQKRVGFMRMGYWVRVQ